jgi:hypothetical protein
MTLALDTQLDLLATKSPTPKHPIYSIQLIHNLLWYELRGASQKDAVVRQWECFNFHMMVLLCSILKSLRLTVGVVISVVTGVIPYYMHEHYFTCNIPRIKRCTQRTSVLLKTSVLVPVWAALFDHGFSQNRAAYLIYDRIFLHRLHQQRL